MKQEFINYTLMYGINNNEFTSRIQVFDLLININARV